MYIKTISLALILCVWQNAGAVTLTNKLLVAADKAGAFMTGILEIIRIRDNIKQLVHGTYKWSGIKLQLEIEDKATNTKNTIDLLVNKPQALFGATYVVLNPDHPLVGQAVHRSLHDRYKSPDTKYTPTTWVAYHPLTQEALPVLISDYRVDSYETRQQHAHLAIPAHDSADFAFATMHKLPIKLVISSPTKGASAPKINRSGSLEMAYQGDYSDCIIINSNNFNGSAKAIREKIIKTVVESGQATEYSDSLKYTVHNRAYSVHDLEMIESTLDTINHQELSINNKELETILFAVQNDFLALVEQFLVNAHESKDLMIALIEESCALRNTPDAYLLIFARMKTAESEISIFKRDIKTFQQLVHFWSELINFLGDFASSCPHTINALKQIKK